MQRNGRLFAHRVQTGFPDLPILEVSLRTGVRVRDMANGKRKQVMSQKAKYKRAARGDIAYNMMRMWQGAVGPAPVDGLVSPAYVVVRPFQEANSAYFSGLYRTQAYMQEVNKFSRGIVSDRNRLYWADFKQMPALVPPRGEQDQIAGYLRAFDVQIANLIRAKRKSTELLAEQRLKLTQAAIDSPQTTSVRLDTLVRPKTTAIVRRASDTYVPIGMFNRGRGVFHKQPTLGAELGDSTFFPIERGDLVLSGQFAWEGAVAIAGDEDHGCVASHRYPIFKVREDRVLAPYLLSFLTTGLGDLLLNHHSRGAAGRNRPLNPRTLLKEKIPVPQMALQLEIVEAWALEQSVRAGVANEIQLILEYRDRVAADVVTGQVDVRTWQPGPGDDEAAVLLGDDADHNGSTEEETDGDD